MSWRISVLSVEDKNESSDGLHRAGVDAHRIGEHWMGQAGLGSSGRTGWRDKDSEQRGSEDSGNPVHACPTRSKIPKKMPKMLVAKSKKSCGVTLEALWVPEGRSSAFP